MSRSHPFVFPRILRVTVLTCLAVFPASAGFAACTGPDGQTGTIRYAGNYGVMAFCNGVEWISMAGDVSVTVGGTTGATTLHDLTDVDDAAKANGTYLKYDGTDWVANNPFGTITDTKWCVGNSSGQVVCNTDAPVLTEVDPKITTLTNTKWCTSDGTSVICNTDAPIITEADPEVGALTASNFCQVNVGGTAIVCGNDAPTQRTALGLGTLATANSVSWFDLTNVPAGNTYVSNTLDATELSYINGLDQSLSTSSRPTFAGVSAAIVTATTRVATAEVCDATGANCVAVGDIGTGSGEGDRITSGTATVIAYQSSHISTSVSLRVSGTIKLAATGDEVCDVDTYYTMRVNPTTGALEMCRP